MRTPYVGSLHVLFDARHDADNFMAFLFSTKGELAACSTGDDRAEIWLRRRVLITEATPPFAVSA